MQMMKLVWMVTVLVIAAPPDCAYGQTTFQFSFEQVTDGSEATPGVDITVPVMITSTNPPTAILTADTIVTVSVSGGNATLGQDYNLPRTEVTFDVGTSPGNTINAIINVLDDLLVEGTECVTLSGGIGSPAAAGSTFVGGPVTVCIEDNDFRHTVGARAHDDVILPSTIRMTSSYALIIVVGLVPDPTAGTPNYQIPESTSPFQFCAQVTTGALARTATVNLVTQQGSAQDTDDYVGGSFPLVFTPMTGNTPVCVPAGNVVIVNDDICEDDETFFVQLSTPAGETQVILNPQTGTATIIDDDVKIIGTDQLSYTVTECEDPQLIFNVIISGTLGSGRSCVVDITTVPGTATGGEDYDAITASATFTSGSASTIQQSINIIEDLDFEPTEEFSISLSTTSPDCAIPTPLVPVTILDDEDCTGMAGMPCDENAMCEELRKRNNFTCTCMPPYVGDGFMCSLVPGPGVGDDPHFSIFLPSGKLLCYTVQGEHGFVFNLISNKMFHMNAMFVPDSHREEVTWLGSMGIIVQNSQYKMSNATYLRFETKGKKIYIGDKVTLLAKNIEKLSFNNGKLTISEATPFKGFRYPSVLVDLQDVGLNFTIKFLNEHLDLFWHSTGKNTKDSHGIIGQFFRKGVEIDETRKILILPGKEPVPVMRRPVWSFMEREVADDQLCWTAMNPGYQGEGLIDGSYFDYLVNDVLSTDFKFKERQ